MDPSVTSLIKTGAFIRHRALQYLYHEYFRIPSRSPDRERSRSAAKTVAVFLSTQTAGGKELNTFIILSYFSVGHKKSKSPKHFILCDYQAIVLITYAQKMLHRSRVTGCQEGVKGNNLIWVIYGLWDVQ